MLINIYKKNSVWFGARWIDGEYDGCDELDCVFDASDEIAKQAAINEFPGADVCRVSDA